MLTSKYPYNNNKPNFTSYLILQRPRLVAKITIGAMEDSKALCKYVKHSMSSIWTSSMNKTPGTSSAMPWSIYLFTTLLISFRSLSMKGGKMLLYKFKYKSYSNN